MPVLHAAEALRVIGVNVNPVLAEAEDTEVDNDWVSVNGGDVPLDSRTASRYCHGLSRTNGRLVGERVRLLF